MTDPKALRELAKRACEAYRQGFTASLPVAEFLEAMLGNGAILSMLDKIEEERLQSWEYGWRIGRNAALRDALRRAEYTYRSTMDDVADRRQAWHNVTDDLRRWIEECEKKVSTQ